MTEKANLAPGLTLRPARWDDVEAVAKLIYDVCEADGDVTVAATSEDMENTWKTEGFNLDRDAFVVEAQDGRLVGYEEFFHPKNQYHDLDADGYVHPKFKGQGIGTTLLRAVEVRAREEMQLAAPDLRVFIRSTIDNKDQLGHEVMKAEGYFSVRYHWRMEIKLQEAPAAVTFPNGIELRPFVKDEHAVAVWEADNEAFRDHWGYVPGTEVRYQAWLKQQDFDPALYKVAWYGDQVAGAVQNFVNKQENEEYNRKRGYTEGIFVRRPWRKRGLARSLIVQSMKMFKEMGMTETALGVDTENLSGALRVYESCGYRQVKKSITLRKPLE